MRIMLPIALAGLAALTGCVGYGGATYSTGGYYGGSPYYSGSPSYGSGAVVIEQRYGYGSYGTYNRRDRDRDRDGVPNRRDARPDNPRRY